MISSALSTITQALADNKKKAIFCLIAGLFTGTVFISDGAYLVKDVKNIAQTVKVYTETAKVVANTLKQVGLSEIDIANINGFLEKFQTKFGEQNKRMENILAEHTGYIGTGFAGDTEFSSADKYLKTIMPVISSDDGKISLNARNVARMVYMTAIMDNNQNVLEATKDIQEGLTEAHKELEDLMEENRKLGISGKKGTLAAQQINNQIKVVQARIDSYNTILKSIMSENEIVRSQAEAQEKQNEVIANKAQTEREIEFGNEAANRLDSNYYANHSAPGLFSSNV